MYIVFRMKIFFLILVFILIISILISPILLNAHTKNIQSLESGSINHLQIARQYV